MFELELWSLARVSIASVLAYSAALIALRLAGKRALAKWSAFDFVITIAVGSAVATAVLSEQIGVLVGIAGIVLLVGVQFVMTWVTLRVGWLRRIVRGKPRLLLLRGAPLDDALMDERVTRSELLAAVRGHGAASLEEVYAVVLETDGNFSVLDHPPQSGSSTLEDVEIADGARDAVSPGEIACGGMTRLQVSPADTHRP